MAVLCALVLSAAVPALAASPAVELVKRQPRVVNAVADHAGNLWVTVVPDARVPWNEFASILCKMVIPFHERIFLVKIVDLSSVGQSSTPRNWRLLGGANCAAQ
jgi:hypothetical protein